MARRWAAEPGIPGVVHVLDPYHGIERGWDSAAQSLAMLEEVIQLEGPNTIAAFILEPVTGTNGVLVPPDGYLEGVRELCTKYGILMICDEVMSGFGRTGEWFAVDHWSVVPDILTMAKGLTSAYVQLGAVGMRRGIADQFKDRVFYGGLTYNSHPLACAAALATIQVYEDDRLIDNARTLGIVMKGLLADLERRHPSVGAVRSIGLFGIVELVRDRRTREPLAPFNGTSAEMTALGQFFRQEGLYTIVRWNYFFANPPLCITEAQLREGFAIIDRALEITDRAVRVKPPISRHRRRSCAFAHDSGVAEGRRHALRAEEIGEPENVIGQRHEDVHWCFTRGAIAGKVRRQVDDQVRRG